MNPKRIRELLEAVKAGNTDVDEAMKSLRDLPYENLDIAMLDHHRTLRTGSPEVIYCEGKSHDHIKKIVESYLSRKVNMLLTRANDDIYKLVSALDSEVMYNEKARAIWRIFDEVEKSIRPVLVISAGTSDIPVAEEACVTAEVLGARVERLYDVGVAGIHRLLHKRELLDQAGAVVVVAGMEGALASVVGGMSPRPVIAVPTSIGYGAAFGGLSALLGMLNSCAPGVVVVNIDNGFGAGYSAAMICRLYKV